MVDTVTEIADELADFVLRSAVLPRPTDRDQHPAFQELARRIYVVAFEHVNRLIRYCRTHHGQYWLVEYEIDEGRAYSAFLNSSAVVRTPDSDWVAWHPPLGQTTRIRGLAGDPSRWIADDAWPEAQAFVQSSRRRTDLVLELLAGAELLENLGFRRNALTQAATAVERATLQFAGSAAATKAYGDLSDRVGGKRLAGAVEELGLRRSWAYLLPLITTEHDLPRAVIADCLDLLDARGTVVHSGQRDVAEADARRLVAAARTACAALWQVTGERHPG